MIGNANLEGHLNFAPHNSVRCCALKMGERQDNKCLSSVWPALTEDQLWQKKRCVWDLEVPLGSPKNIASQG